MPKVSLIGLNQRQNQVHRTVMVALPELATPFCQTSIFRMFAFMSTHAPVIRIARSSSDALLRLSVARNTLSLSLARVNLKP
jgi:hypothetical protein